MRNQQLSESICLQDAAMNLLATGYSIEEAAETLGVTANAINIWRRRNPSFKRTVKNISEKVKQQSWRE
jgi:hypothetical protein